MSGVLLYQPGARWQIAVALSAAVLIHLSAVAVANFHGQTSPSVLPSESEPPEIVFEPNSPVDSAPPPLDLVDPPPIRDSSNDLFTETPTPPPVRRQVRPVMPIVKAGHASAGSVTLSSAKVLATNAPRPEYPYEARRQKITGSGTVVMSVDPVTGTVTDASMWQSTGNQVLDNATLAAFRRWRFKPGTVTRVKSPITFTMTGAAY